MEGLRDGWIEEWGDRESSRTPSRRRRRWSGRFPGKKDSKQRASESSWPVWLALDEPSQLAIAAEIGGALRGAYSDGLLRLEDGEAQIDSDSEGSATLRSGPRLPPGSVCPTRRRGAPLAATRLEAQPVCRLGSTDD
jgi:hypothetical protein